MITYKKLDTRFSMKGLTSTSIKFAVVPLSLAMKTSNVIVEVIIVEFNERGCRDTPPKPSCFPWLGPCSQEVSPCSHDLGW
jgi:hypothetical protein